MSNRREQFGTSIPSPVVRYYTWASNEKGFRYYDKEKKENIVVFPLSFVFITARSTVRGWNDQTESAIYANEVKNTAKEALQVYTSKPNKQGNTLLATGIYKEIKSNLAGGHFEKVVYGYEKGVGIVKINLKGSGLQAYSNFEKENKNLFDNFVTISTFESAKKGATKYTVPNFTLGEKVDSETDKIVDEAFKEVTSYLNAKGNKAEESKDDYLPDFETGEDEDILPPVTYGADLPF